MKGKKENFTFWIHSEDAEIGRSRSLTKEEEKYLRYSNWIRLMQLFGYLFLLVFGIGALFVLAVLLMMLVDLESYSLLTKALIRVGPALIVAALVILAVRKKIPWGISLWPKVSNLEAFELTGALGVDLTESRSWKLNKTSFLMPEHWEKYVPKMYPDENRLPRVTLWAVRRKGTTGRTYVYISSTETGKIVNRFQDFTYYALSCGTLSVSEDNSQKLPYFRANSFWVGCTILLVVTGIFLSIYFSIKLENNNKAVASADYTVSMLENELNLGSAIDTNIFSLRRIPAFKADEDYGNQVLVSTRQFKYYSISIRKNSRPFLVMPDELEIIRRVSTVAPKVLLGYKKPSAKTLNDYRNQIKSVIVKSTDSTGSLQRNALAALSTITDEVLEQQMRSYGNRFSIDLDFAFPFMPTPYIFMPKGNHSFTQTYINHPNFFRQAKDKPNMKSEAMAIINADTSINDGLTGVQIIYAQKLKALKKHKEQGKALNYIDPFAFWTRDLGVIGLITVLVALGFLTSYFQANNAVSKFYDQKLSNK